MLTNPLPSRAEERSPLGQLVRGQVKWFDPAKGFGFIADSEGKGDILLHGNVLRSFGQSSIVEGTLVEVTAIETVRGRQVAKILSITILSTNATVPIAELAGLSDADIAALPLLPARVKWFDRSKGFGFANVFGRKGDIFLHLDILHRFGFADLVSGEAVCLRVFLAERGMVAVEISAWEKAVAVRKLVAEDNVNPDLLAQKERSGPAREF